MSWGLPPSTMIMSGEQTIESVINHLVSLLGIGEGAVYRITLLGLKSPNDGLKAQRPPLDVNAHQIGHGNTDVDIRSRWVLLPRRGTPEEGNRRRCSKRIVPRRAMSAGGVDHRLAGTDPWSRSTSETIHLARPSPAGQVLTNQVLSFFSMTRHHQERPRYLRRSLEHGAPRRSRRSDQVVKTRRSSPSWVWSPTQATYPSGGITTAVGAVTAPSAGKLPRTHVVPRHAGEPGSANSPSPTSV